MTRKRAFALVLLAIAGSILVANALSPRPAATDFGRWGVVVVQSDDWGFEGWFPNAASSEALADLVEDVPARLQPYRTSSLETAVEIDSMAAFLATIVDADGLPLVLQANTVVAGVDVMGASQDKVHLHASGQGEGPYFRPGLGRAVDAAIESGVWWPELHGLTHYDLDALLRATQAEDPIASRAATYGVVAYRGWRRDTELGAYAPDRALSLATRSVELFEARFGRRPYSVIAPDYRWGHDDERAWIRLGLVVVQAKREQIDPRLGPGSLWGRVAKVVLRTWDVRAKDLVYLERPGRLEPYGSLDLAGPQGAETVATAVHREWRYRRPGIVSIHRVQFVNFDPTVPSAGRHQLRELARRLSADRPVRFLVDAEIAQLWRTGVSVLDRGRWRIVRNYSGRAQVVDVWEDETGRFLTEGTHVFLRSSRQPAGSPSRSGVSQSTF